MLASGGECRLESLRKAFKLGGKTSIRVQEGIECPLGSSSVLPMNKGKADSLISSFGSVQTAIIPPNPPVYDLAIDITSWKAFRQ